VTNESSVPQNFIWGHHPTLGEAFLDESCVIDIPARKAGPALVARQPLAGNLISPGLCAGWGGGVIDLSVSLARHARKKVLSL
jgi:hypothetical protein